MNLICCHVATNMQDHIFHYINKMLLLGKRKNVARNAFRFSPKIGPVIRLIFQENIWGGSKLRKKVGSFLTGGGTVNTWTVKSLSKLEDEMLLFEYICLLNKYLYKNTYERTSLPLMDITLINDLHAVSWR